MRAIWNGVIAMWHCVRLTSKKSIRNRAILYEIYRYARFFSLNYKKRYKKQRFAANIGAIPRVAVNLVQNCLFSVAGQNGDGTKWGRFNSVLDNHSFIQDRIEPSPFCLR